MINTFEAWASAIAGDGFAYMAGYVDAMDSDEFIAMSEAAGAEGTDEFIGARYRPDQSVYGILHQRNLFETRSVPDESDIAQRSVGEARIGDFSTHLISARLEYITGPQKFRVGMSRTDEGGGIKKPYGNPANYLSIIDLIGRERMR